MDTNKILWIALIVVGILYFLKRRSRMRSED
jgi:hypothetical protein